MIVHGDEFFAEGRAEALLHVDEDLKNKFRINLVSLAGLDHERHQIPQACDHLQHCWLDLDG